MPVKNVDLKIIKSLTSVDKRILSSIYEHRCLNEDLIYKFFYKKVNVSREFTARKIRWMIHKKLIEAVEYGLDFPALFLTTFGIETIRYVHNIPYYEYDEQSGENVRTLEIASKLKMKANNLKHQMALNEFVLKFDERVSNNFKYKYVDEKFLNLSMVIRPDGLIQFCDIDVYLEIDMATESKKYLLTKWGHYREYQRCKSFQERRIVVMFILNNVTRVEKRRETILKSINQGIIDIIDYSFDFYVGTQDEILDILFKDLTPNGMGRGLVVNELIGVLSSEHKYVCSTSLFMSNIIPSFKFDAYIRIKNDNGNILIENSRPQEFLVDIYWNKPMSILKQVLFYSNQSVFMRNKIKRVIPYLVIVDDETRFFKELKLMDYNFCEDVFFTTKERLQGVYFPNVVFQYDQSGSVFHFSDNGFRNRVFEKIVLII